MQNGRESLGDSIYRTITDDYFDPNGLLDSVDLSTEHKIVDLKDRIEASVVIWQRKLYNKLSWGPVVSLEKREQFEERAETVLLILKHKFPGSAQSSLDISKIQYNKVLVHREAAMFQLLSGRAAVLIFSCVLQYLFPIQCAAFLSGCWVCHLGELLQGSRELGVHGSVADRGPLCRHRRSGSEALEIEAAA